MPPLATSHAPPLGRRRTDRSRPVIRLRLKAGAVPAHPAAADHLAQVPAWCGATNQRFGTCGPCDTFNGAIMSHKYLLGLDVTGADDDVFDFYRRSGNPGFDPATGAGDNGVDMTVMLAEAVRNGITVTHADGTKEVIKPLCFAAAGTSADEVRAVTDVFGGSSLAWTLETAQQGQGSLWDYQASALWGGHATFGGKYQTPAGGALHAADETVITWQQPVGVTDSLIAHQLDEHYAVVWPELWDHPGFDAAVDKAALAADYTALTGRPFPAPVPPAPVPPAPAPPGDLPADVRAYLDDPVLHSWASLHHTGKTAGNAYAAAQYNLISAARGNPR